MARQLSIFYLMAYIDTVLSKSLFISVVLRVQKVPLGSLWLSLEEVGNEWDYVLWRIDEKSHLSFFVCFESWSNIIKKVWWEQKTIKMLLVVCMFTNKQEWSDWSTYNCWDVSLFWQSPKIKWDHVWTCFKKSLLITIFDGLKVIVHTIHKFWDTFRPTSHAIFLHTILQKKILR